MRAMKGETWASANRRRACMNCGESGANCYYNKDNMVPTRVCILCISTWLVPTIPRDPFPCEKEVDTTSEQ
jgi:hypothetical protein